MLLKIRDYIQHQKITSTQQLAREFHIDSQALQPMLDIWVKKSLIRPCQTTTCQSTCNKLCKKNTPIFYEWI